MVVRSFCTSARHALVASASIAQTVRTSLPYCVEGHMWPRGSPLVCLLTAVSRPLNDAYVDGAELVYQGCMRATFWLGTSITSSQFQGIRVCRALMRIVLSINV
eukprot:scaffold118239_cov24-Tisochrysis_lutea.AAC.1